MIKAVEVLRRRVVPGNLHFSSLNPKIDVSGFDVVIGSGSVGLASSGSLVAGVSSFGFGGTNAHVVLESYDRPHRKRWSSSRRDAWLFTGQGSLKSGAAQQLYDANRAFREALDQHTEELSTQLNAPILRWLLEPSPENDRELQQTQFQQPALVAMQLAQIAMWEERGFQPSSVLGHSIGEFAAAVAAGVMHASDALSLSVARGQLMSEAGAGAMAAVMVAADELIPTLPAGVVVAAENGPTLTVVAGPTETLRAFVREAYPEAHVMLDVSHAFHSPMMQGAAADFGKSMQSLALAESTEGVEFISTLSGNIEADRLRTPEYWRDQIVSPVRFLQAVRTLFEQPDSIDAVIEIGPGSTLVNLAKRIAPDARTHWISSAETTGGAPGLSPLRPVSVPWEKPNAKKPLNRGVPTGGPDAVASSAVSADCLYSSAWVEAVVPSESMPSGVHVLLSCSDVDVDLPEGWVSRVVFDVESVEDVLGEQGWACVAVLSDGRESDVHFGLRVLQVCSDGRVPAPDRIVFLSAAESADDAGLRGLARTARLEHPELAVHCLDVSAGHLVPALALSQGVGLEQEYRISDAGVVEVPRLQRHVLGGGEFVAAPDVTYVVSGGLGALGLVVAEFLVDRGARHLVLLSRSAGSVVSEEVSRLRQVARVECIACDVSDLRSVRDAHDAVSQAGMPAVAGVVHAAGVLTDGVLANQSGAKLKQAYGAKVRGAKNLRSVFAPSEFLVLFSSAAATFGSAGQGSYAAANATLDALAESWSARGERVLSIQWGAWSEAGMAVRHDAVSRSEASGFGVIDNELGIAVLAQLLGGLATGTVCASPIDWQVLAPTEHRFGLMTSASLKPQPSQSWTTEDLERVVQANVRRFMPSAASDFTLPFMEAGLSSLDLVQFRKGLLTELPDSVVLPAHFAFNYPTVREVVKYLATQLNADAPEAAQVQHTVWKHLNDKNVGEPLFLVGGVMGSVEKTFGTLAQALSIPVYGAMPPLPANPHANGIVLEAVASDLREAMMREVPSSRYSVGGMSFGATLALEMGLQLEQEDMLSKVVMLDPRHMAPFVAPSDAAPFEELLEHYRPQGTVASPVMVFQCGVPPLDQQSEMMREASRSFQSSAEIVERCRAHSSSLELIPTEGHHFNFLYKYFASIARRIEQAGATGREQELGSVPIAIVGSACRLPGDVYSPEDFWQMLQAGTDCVDDIPISRFDIGEVFDASPDAVGRSYTRRGAFMSDVEYFDHSFFGISPAEAKMMDPQQRLMLEVSFDALQNAGFDRDSLRGAPISVHMGLANDDWTSMGRDSEAHNPFFGAGVSGSIMSNRISYLLGLTGPSMTIDTACSSSLVAVDLAVEKLRSGVCSAALVGGVNVMLHHRMYVSACATRALSPEGRCATFDVSADGYCRGEGVGAVVLKRLSDAVVDGDRVLAVIRGTAV
ncbi:SDR family NAD(P)-dependent oxidoreductase, partial [Nocardia sp. NPDC058518]|uniref:SDR family NAD(P)-dependent oxidoreductase n=1 Tax=Nocardia sp. NPDC058518 TaxID=3346534 RepID=UPI0036629709